MGYFSKEFKIILHVEDYDNAIFFYREALGLLPNYTWFIIPGDNGTRFYLCDSKLEVVKNQTPAPQGKSTMVIQSTNVDACFGIMSQFPNITILKKPASTPFGMRFFKVQDPNNNTIMVMQYGEAKESAPGRENIFDKELISLFYVRNMAAAKEFYSGILELEIEKEWDNGPRDMGCKYIAGKGFVELTTQEAPQGHGPGMIALEADNVNECYNAMRKKGVSFLTDIQDTYAGLRLFRILDPDQNVVEVYSYLENIRDLKVETID